MPHRSPVPRFAEDRIDGWKSIAAYFRRDRTTVIRWARERALPVHRLPGGRVGTVYALRSELDRWASLRIDGAEPPDAPLPGDIVADRDVAGLNPPVPATTRDRPLPVPSPPIPVARRRARLLALAGATLLIAAVPLATLWPGDRGTATAALPVDRGVAAHFLLARDLVAARSPAPLARGIALLQNVTAAAPDFAPGHAALAEALLLSREFGQQDDAQAFDRARIAARRAIRLAPDLPMARRAMGFIAYWADHDRAEADEQFRAALKTDPDDALTRFWYGNILSDRGDHIAALRELDRARLAMPGSVALMTDYGWALWSAGREDEGIAILHWVAQAHPDFAVVHECLSIIALAHDDMTAYARHFVRFARLRQSPSLQRDATELDRATPGDPTAIRRVAVRRAVRDLSDGMVASPAVAMLVAARAKRWEAIATRLRIGETRRERWGEATILDRVIRLSPDPRYWSNRLAPRRI